MSASVSPPAQSDEPAADMPAVREKVSTGAAGLDEVLGGGLTASRNYLLRGGPGSGKTTLGLQFLAAGAAVGDPVLYASLTAPESEVRADAAAVGLPLDDITVMDLSPESAAPADGDLDELLVSNNRRRTPLVRSILVAAQEHSPRRVVVDSMTQFRELTEDADEFRRHTLALVRTLTSIPSTVLFTSEYSPRAPDDDLQFLADGVISLETTADSHHVTVTKLRGSSFRHGRHSVRIGAGGVHVYPRLAPDRYQQVSDSDSPSFEKLSFGVPELNEVLYGGLERATITMLSGPSGVGKTTVGAQFMKEAAGRGERSVVFMFDESAATFVHRCESLGMPIREMMQQGALTLRSMEPLAHSPDEISEIVRSEVEDYGTTTVMFDSISSYRISVSAEDQLAVRLHALGRYLKNMGVTGLLIEEVPAVTGVFQVSQYQVSYLADTVLLLRHLEIGGELRKAIGVLKKRTSDYENTLREISFSPNGIKVGGPLHHLRGILTGTPSEATSPTDEHRT